MTDFPKVGGWAVFPKIGSSFSKSRWLICPESVLISSKSVTELTEFHKIGGRVSQLLAGLYETQMCGLICSMLVAFLLRVGF